MNVDANKAKVLDYIGLIFTPGRAREACEKHLAAHFIQHSPDIPDGRDAVIAFAEKLLGMFPTFRYQVRRVIAEGDLVCLHAHGGTDNPDDRGAVLFDLFRLENGAIVEHWDSVQMIPATAANPHPMF